MSTHLLAPIRFNILVANILVISEAYPRLSSNVENSLPILSTDAEFTSEKQKAEIILSIHAGMVIFELLGQTLGFTFFQYIQSTISIGNFAFRKKCVKI